MEQIIREAGLDLRHPQADASDKVVTLLRSQGQKGIWIAAPTPLHVDQDHDVQISVFDYFSTQQRGRRDLRRSGIVVATRIESRETLAALIREPKEPAPAAARDQPRPIPPSEIIQRFDFSLRERLPQLPWRAGTYLVDLILEPDLSNRLQFTVTSGEAAQKDAAVTAYIEAHRGASQPRRDVYPAVVADAVLPNYQRNPGSLALPSEEGIAMSIERVTVFRPGARWSLKGAWRLHVPAAFYDSSGSAMPLAAVPITLVITGNVMTGPFTVPLVVPSYDRVDRNAPESVLTGHFEIDLFALSETSKVPQTYTIRAYSGYVRSEPIAAAVITPDMLE